jgi:hypothetical protein
VFWQAPILVLLCIETCTSLQYFVDGCLFCFIWQETARRVAANPSLLSNYHKRNSSNVIDTSTLTRDSENPKQIQNHLAGVLDFDGMKLDMMLEFAVLSFSVVLAHFIDLDTLNFLALFRSLPCSMLSVFHFFYFPPVFFLFEFIRRTQLYSIVLCLHLLPMPIFSHLCPLRVISSMTQVSAVNCPTIIEITIRYCWLLLWNERLPSTVGYMTYWFLLSVPSLISEKHRCSPFIGAVLCVRFQQLERRALARATSRAVNRAQNLLQHAQVVHRQASMLTITSQRKPVQSCLVPVHNSFLRDDGTRWRVSVSVKSEPDFPEIRVPLRLSPRRWHRCMRLQRPNAAPEDALSLAASDQTLSVPELNRMPSSQEQAELVNPSDKVADTEEEDDFDEIDHDSDDDADVHFTRDDPRPPSASPSFSVCCALCASDSSFFLFAPNNWLRLKCRVLMEHAWFSYYVDLVTVVACVILAMQDPTVTEGSAMYMSLHTAQTVATFCFLFEMVVKCITLGFLLGDRNSYLRSAWNVLDFLIVVSSVWSLYAPSSARSLNILRAFRPLRIVTNSPSQRLLLESLVRILPFMFNVVLFLLFTFYVCSVVAVAYFAGILKQCINPFTGLGIAGFSQANCTAPNVWASPPGMGNFDTVPSALLLMFELSTEENWPVTMYAFVDANPGSLSGPVADNNPYRAVFFVTCVFLTSLFIKDLFVGTLVDQFNARYEEITGTSDLSDDEKTWLDLYRQMVLLVDFFFYTHRLTKTSYTEKFVCLLFIIYSLIHLLCNTFQVDNAPQLRPHRPSNSKFGSHVLAIRRIMFDMTQHPYFDYVMLVFIFLQGILLCTVFYQQSQSVVNILNIATNINLFVFVAEMVFKWMAFGFREYWDFRWNVFDAALNLLGIIDFVNQALGVTFNPKIFRIIRSLRMVRFVQIYPGLQTIVRTLAYVINMCFLSLSLSLSLSLYLSLSLSLSLSTL